jgi:hypothetical protein
VVLEISSQYLHLSFQTFFLCKAKKFSPFFAIIVGRFIAGDAKIGKQRKTKLGRIDYFGVNPISSFHSRKRTFLLLSLDIFSLLNYFLMIQSEKAKQRKLKNKEQRNLVGLTPDLL